MNLMDHLIVTPKDDLVLQQMELEQGMTDLGIARYRERLEKDVKRGSEDATAYGNTLLSQCTEKVAEGVREFIIAADNGKAGRRHAALKYLKQIDARVAAYLALKFTLRGVSKVTRIQGVASQISAAIEDEIRYREVRSEDAGLYRYLKGEAAKRDDARNKRTTVNFLLNKFEKEWEPWSRVASQHVGSKMIDIIIQTVGLVEVAHHNEGRNNTVLTLRPTEETKAWIADRNTAASLLAPVYEPMVTPPTDWKAPRGGGYLTRSVRPLQLVKSRSRGYLEELDNIDMPLVYAGVNAAQATAWSVNGFILDTLSAIWDASSVIGGVPPKMDLEVPPKPHDIDENEEARKEWRGLAAQVHRENRELSSSRSQFAYTLATATKYQRFAAIYFPHQLDFRGRIYAVPQLNPQGPDFMKALLHFSEPKPLTEEGATFLAIHLANCGAFNKVDKGPLEERVQWVYDNEAMILAVAQDPFEHRQWADADSPFQFLAACKEWAGWLEHGEGFPSCLAVALDGSCSGIQHFSMALRDEVGGAAVNLVASDKPADIYSMVMAKTYAKMEKDAAGSDDAKRDIATQWLAFQPGRSCFKRPTMTYGYGSRAYGFRDQVMTDTLRPAHKAFLKGEGPWPFEADGFAASLYMANAIAEAVDEVVLKAAEAMNWLKDTATLISKEGLPVRWTTPDGFPVLQAYRDLKRQRVETMINGSRVVMTSTSPLPGVDKRAQAQGISPNFVHSLDGTHLRLSVVRAHEEGMRSFALVHDSFGVHAADTPRFFQLLRETLVEMYTVVDVVGNFRAEILEQLDDKHKDDLKEAPQPGNLDLMSVIDSPFCFA